MIDSNSNSKKTYEEEDQIEKDLELGSEQLILNWKYKDVKKKLTYDIKKCIGCSLCKLVCPVDAIEIGAIPEIAQNIINDSNPKILIDHEKCCYCMLCAIVCPNDAFHENFEPKGHINLEEFPSISKFYKIDEKDCIEDKKNEICQLCLQVRDRNNIEDYFKIEKECPTQCFHIDSPIEGEVIIKKNMLYKCDPQGCKACVNICPVESFFIPETAEDVVKYGKIACNVEKCFFCGACENSCPDDLILVDRRKVEIVDPKTKGSYPWIDGWIKNIKKILRIKLIGEKQQLSIPFVEQQVEKIKELTLDKIPQINEDDKKKLNELNEKVQTFLKSSKIRYWIEDKKIDKITKELRKILDE